MNNYSWTDPPGLTSFPIAKAGYPLIFGCAFVTAIFALLGLTILTLISLAFTFFVCCFFRDPDRVIPKESGAIVSPADGKVIAAGVVANSAFYESETMKISIFMSVFNVHVNRIPYNGQVKRISYHPGKFVSANLDKASLENEHNAVFLETDKGDSLCFVQVAGLIARRIICHIQPGENVERGKRYGMICFGSRLDVYLPQNVSLNVRVGDKVQAGFSILAHLPGEV